MLRTSLNFAAHPIRNYPLYSTAFRVAALALAGLTLLHVQFALRALGERADARALLAEARETEARASGEMRLVEERLRGPGVVEIHMKTAWANALIEARLFSWTALLDDLEGVLPPNAFVQTILPSRQKDGSVELRLAVVAKTPADLAELLDALEDARRKPSGEPMFTHAYPSGERQSLVPNLGDIIQSDVSVVYLPPPGSRSDKVPGKKTEEATRAAALAQGETPR